MRQLIVSRRDQLRFWKKRVLTMFIALFIVLDSTCANKLKTGRKYVAVRSSKPLIHSYYAMILDFK